MLDHRKEKLRGTRTGVRRRRSPIGVSGLLLAAAVVTAALVALAGPGGGGYTSIAEAQEPSLLDEQALTRAYVQEAIAYYDEHGRDATVEFYRSAASVEDQRTLILIDTTENTLLVYRNIPALQGQYVGPGSRYAGLSRLAQTSAEEGVWETTQGVNPVTKQEEPRRVFAILHDGLVFSSSHSALVSDVEASVREYVAKATAKYDQDGLDAVIAHYNSEDSLEGQFYLFLIGADDLYLAHPIFPHLIGTDIKDVVGSDGQELGKEIALATEDGIWVEYLWPHPVTRREQQKVTWAIRHDGLIFASGYCAGAPEAGSPAWRDADPREYTVQYVNRAVERYEQEGLESFLNYYNSVASFEGQWYLFATDADDIYHVHPLIPELIGTDIKAVVGSDGYELGKELAKAVDGGDGVWVEYLWPHPVTRRELQKVTWAIRHDGLIFASGYYAGAPESGSPAWRDADPREYTVQYVHEAIERYERDGLQSFLSYYNSVASFEGEWYLFATDADDIYHVHPLIPRLIGTDIKDVVGSDGFELGKELAKAVDGGEGVWVEYLWPHPVTLKEAPKVGYAVRRDGMLFASGYYVRKADPVGYTKEYVAQAIEHYKDNGLEATIEWYNSRDSLDGQWGLTLADENDIILVAHLATHLVGSDLKNVATPRRPIGEELVAATEEGIWVSYVLPNIRSSERLYAHTWAIRYDGLLFMSRYHDDQPDVPGAAE